MQKVISAVVVLFSCLPRCRHLLRRPRRAKPRERRNWLPPGTPPARPAAPDPDVSLIDQATLKLPAGYSSCRRPKAPASCGRSAMSSTTSFVGLVVGTGPNDRWIVVIRYIKEGYIKDDDAKNWNADDLLKNIKDGVEESNKDRVARGFPEMQVIGWVQPPSYDAATHRLVWSLLAKDKDEPDNAREEHQLQYLRAGTGRLFQPQSAVRIRNASPATRRWPMSCSAISPTTPASATRTSAPLPIASRNMA